MVVDEIQRVAAFADGSAELKAFNERIASRVAERERQAAKFLGTPPGFGARDGNSDWANLLLQLERSPGERKSLVLKPEFAKVRALLDSNRNCLARSPRALEHHRRRRPTSSARGPAPRSSPASRPSARRASPRRPSG